MQGYGAPVLLAFRGGTVQLFIHPPWLKSVDTANSKETYNIILVFFFRAIVVDFFNFLGFLGGREGRGWLN